MSDEKTAREYFEELKAKKQTINDADLEKVYDNCMTLINKYKITGQVDGMKKLIFHLESLEKEREIVKAGIDTFVYLSDIKKYIAAVSDRSVKCIELSRFEREIPDEIVDELAKVKELFDEFFVVFTDYTKVHEEKAKKERDPILFGIFKDNKSSTIVERCYFIGDWEDEYCDLTLEKMVNFMQKKGKEIEHTIKTPEDLEELKDQIRKLEAVDNTFVIGSASTKTKKSVIGRLFSRG
ncbi:MAG: hypothetical protein PQJ59_16795 [Spirochaetales bacterium]|nr:hypothetical protein [Spirochaetales bacterium]